MLPIGEPIFKLRFFNLLFYCHMLLKMVHLLAATVITIITGNPYLMLVLKSFILSLSLSLGYTLFLNEMLPSKYASWITFFPQCYLVFKNIFSTIRQTSIELTIVSILITSAIIGLIGLAETILLRDKAAKLVITT